MLFATFCPVRGRVFLLTVRRASARTDRFGEKLGEPNNPPANDVYAGFAAVAPWARPATVA